MWLRIKIAKKILEFDSELRGLEVGGREYVSGKDGEVEIVQVVEMEDNELFSTFKEKIRRI